MVWVLFLLVALLVIAVTAAAFFARITPEPVPAPVTSTPLPMLDSPITADDLDAIRFDTAVRGYRADQVDEVMDRVAERIRQLEGGEAPSPHPTREIDQEI